MQSRTAGIFTPARIVALALIAILTAGLTSIRVSQGSSTVSVPAGAKAGQLNLSRCTYATENGDYAADCGTLIVPENRANQQARLIALPVTRIRAKSGHSGEPIFRLKGGPGLSNMKFAAASRFADDHDVIVVGYRGVDGSSVLACPEVTTALKHASDLLDAASLHTDADAFRACAKRLSDGGVDLAGYSLAQRVDDLEAARTALGYGPIDLLSESTGTRTAMIYSWRYPGSIHRSVMIGVNPPGHFVWNPAITDEQIQHYAQLCAQDASCRTRTGDLAASMRLTASQLPDRWLFLRIKKGNARLATFFGLFDSLAAPPTAPQTFDSWLSAAGGDASGLWFNSLAADLLFPTAFVWGEFAATGIADAQVASDYFAHRQEHNSILDNPGTTFVWAGGELASAWPAAPGDAEYRQARTSQVPTLLIGGTLDVTTPAQVATKELLPFLPNGHQVVLAELGHAPDFWAYQPQAGRQLITAFLDHGAVDESRYLPAKVDFSPGLTQPTLAKLIAGTMIALAVLAVLSLAWMAYRVRTRGGLGRKTRVLLRSLYPAILGLGGWCLAALIVLTALPGIPLDDELLTTVAVGLPISLGIYLAWVNSDRSPNIKTIALATAAAAALVGAWLGYNTIPGPLALITTIVAAATGANLALLSIDIVQSRSST